jgi:hypothetical protein
MAVPRARRLGLYGPFAALAIAVAAWSAGWFWLKDAVERRLDATAVRGKSGASGLAWTGRSVHGYPFRLDIDFVGASWREPSGWAVSAPILKCETFVFAPDHWVAVAPAGVVLTRPSGGAVNISARVLRASLSAPTERPATVSLEGLGLTFTPASGAASYFLRNASELHVHTRAGPKDQGAFYVELDGATLGPDGVLGRVAAGEPITFLADAIYSHASALVGASWAGAVTSWAAAGGQVEFRRLRLRTDAAELNVHGAGVTVDTNGRLEGVLDATLAGATDRVTLNFAAGRTSLGPVAIGPSPKVY